VAAELKKAGRGDDAAQVKALPKPSSSAWAVNQLYWQQRDAFDRLMLAGERFRKAQAEQLAGHAADLREPLSARGSALTELTRHAAATLRQGQHHPTPQLMRRLTLTLEALSAYGNHAEGVHPGRLTKDVDPPGFDSLAALVPRVGGLPKGSGTKSRLLAFDRPGPTPPATAGSAEERQQLAKARKAAHKAATEALEAAQATARAARAALKSAEDKARKAAGRVKETEAEKLRAEQALERATVGADEARQEARRLTAAAAEAADALEDADRAAERAAADLQRLLGE
jgi:hypothetical protein